MECREWDFDWFGIVLGGIRSGIGLVGEVVDLDRICHGGKRAHGSQRLTLGAGEDMDVIVSIDHFALDPATTFSLAFTFGLT